MFASGIQTLKGKKVTLRRTTGFRPWMFIYAGLITAVAFSGEHRDPTQSDAASVAPVAMESEFLIVEPDSIVRRSDI